ncbi:MAG: hypothetical protein JO031_14020 [Ktedonobacteraceae bacterium]|nr:hypothetical protein [Ktedonobacteraceae bacterium]
MNGVNVQRKSAFRPMMILCSGTEPLYDPRPGGRDQSGPYRIAHENEEEVLPGGNARHGDTWRFSNTSYE